MRAERHEAHAYDRVRRHHRHEQQHVRALAEIREREIQEPEEEVPEPVPASR